jgi:carbon storage regulator
MLIVARRRDESIMIGDHVEIRILEIARKQVKIGVQAPREISLHRREVWERIKQGGQHGEPNEGETGRS